MFFFSFAFICHLEIRVVVVVVSKMEIPTPHGAIPGKIMNSMDDSVDLSFNGKTPNWAKEEKAPYVYGKTIEHYDTMLNRFEAFQSVKQNTIVNRVDVGGREAIRLYHDGLVHSYNVKGTIHIPGFEIGNMYETTFKVINKNDTEITISNDGNTTVGLDGKPGNKAIIPANFEGNVSLYWIPSNKGIHFHFRNFNEIKKTDLIIEDMYTKEILEILE